MTEYEDEEFPECKGCFYFIDNKCNDKNAHLRDDCYRREGDFVNPAFEKWWAGVHDSN